MKRTFIAIRIEPDDQMKLLLKELRAGLSASRIKWVETDNLHITLAFLGDTTDSNISLVKQVLQSVSRRHSKFTLEFKNIGLFRSIKNPKVIWLGASPSRALPELREAICSNLITNGLYNDTRPFKPHLTLGRPKYIKEIDYLEGIIDKTRDRIIQTSAIDKVVFFESILSQKGPVYKVLGEYHLS